LTGISQEKAGAIIGVTFQQIQKYEKGVNRVSLGTLAVFADAFDLPVTWFLEGAPGVAGESEVGNPDVGTALLSTPGGIDLASDYLAIKNHVDRAVVAQVARALAGKAGV
jgi:transcriptional regulator with XRE-family HTH domain